MKNTFTLLILSLFLSQHAAAQDDDLLKSIEADLPKEKEFTQATFKGTRLINGHTIEVPGKNTLEFRVAHRFGDVRNGEKDFWGLDNAHMNITLDYSFDGRFAFGIGRNSYRKLYEGTLKYKLLRQTQDHKMPLSLTAVAKGNLLSNTSGSDYDDPFNQLSYFSELIFARKFSKSLSFQLSPSFIHFNLAEETMTSNNIAAISVSGRYKFTKSIALTGEFTQTLNDYYYKDQVSYVPVASFGFDLETGGHVFQLFFSNAPTLNEVQYIPLTTQDWGRREFRFGFNISRNFTVGGKKKPKS